MASFFHKTQEGNGRSGLVLWFVYLDSWVTIAKWEDVIPSCGVSLPLPDAFEVSWFSHASFRFTSWEEPLFPRAGIQALCIQLLSCLCYLVTINKNKTLFVTIHVLYTETAVGIIVQYMTYFHAYTLTLYSLKNCWRYIS